VDISLIFGVLVLLVLLDLFQFPFQHSIHLNKYFHDEFNLAVDEKISQDFDICQFKSFLLTNSHLNQRFRVCLVKEFFSKAVLLVFIIMGKLLSIIFIIATIHTF
jgi:hypothetical protein